MSMKVIALNGPPCSGKTSVMQDISKRYNCPILTIGNVVKESSKSNPEIRKYLESGKVKSIPESLLVPIVRDYFEKLAKENHKFCLFQRGPWSKTLASGFEESGLNIDLFVSIDVDEDSLYERIKYRRIDPLTSKVYNIKEEKPVEVIRKRLRVKLGDEKYLFKRRLFRYNKRSSEIVDFYRKKGNLRVVDGTLPKKKVIEELRIIIDTTVFVI